MLFSKRDIPGNVSSVSFPTTSQLFLSRKFRDFYQTHFGFWFELHALSLFIWNTSETTKILG